jgi:tellurite resistance protein TerC
MTSLHAPAWAWAAIIAALAALLCADLLGSRRDRPPRMAEAAWWTLATVILAVAFGMLLALTAGGTASGQFFAGWLTEYSLSLDNLLVFVILISRSPVPGRLHSRVVLAGIGLAILLRGAVIGLGAAALHRFAWLEYLFGAFLLFTAARVARRGAGTLPAGNAPAQAPPEGTGALAARLTRRRGSRPVLMLVIALGVTDVMFALDSIPAVFGLTRDPFLVFSANVFALLGLRHLFFLVAGLLARLIYLRAGLCVILAFIGVKLIGEALRESGVTRLGPAPVPAVNAWLSLAIIAVVLAATALASVVATRRRRARRELADPAVCGEGR